jgi:hypothetical protein
MTVTFTPGLLASGQLATGSVNFYTVPVSTDALIKNIILVNTSSGLVNITLYVDTGSGLRNLINPNMDLNDGSKLVVSDLFLSSGMSVGGSASTGSVVDYTIHGVEQA